MAIVKLTQDFINNQLMCPVGVERFEYVSDERTGLYVEVRKVSNGYGTYYLRYKDANGKSCHQKVGRTAEMSLAEARQKVKELKAEIALGADPRAEEKARLAVITFDDFFKEHYLPYAEARKRSWESDELLYRLRISPRFGTKRLNQVTRLQIQSFHAAVKDEGLAPATANHYVKLIRRMFNLAMEWQMVDSNPASRIPMFPEDNKIERYMNDDELSRLLEVLRTDHRRSICLIAMFLLSTGARLNEALSATWDQIDQEKRVWRVPASNSKSKRMRVVPLNDSAMDVINQLDTEGKYDHLFINKKREKPYVSISKIWEELRDKAGLPHLRIHDLRHQFASFLVNGGNSLYTVQQILGHSDPSVTQRYAHLSTQALQEAASSASLAIGSVQPVAKVAVR
jgi:integrase